ncbi:hypothetical protein [Streptomyces sp. NPDC021622]|uniref:hypothetical protein n=1 Tax=Streptomyces sp. NPDC021622 TaxID=3155013 RepID=UPI0033ED5048
MNLRSTIRIAGVGGALALAIAGGATTAYASDSGPERGADRPSAVTATQPSQQGDVATRGAVGHYSKVIKKTATKNYTNTKNEIARCTAQSAGMTCTINKTASATRTIDAGFGMSRGAVAGSLNISSSKTQSVSVTCSAPVKKGKSLVAYPIGTRYKYKIEKHITTPLDYVAGTSGWKYAFNPSAAKVSCKVK